MWTSISQWQSIPVWLSQSEPLLWAIFPQMYLWIHDKYSSMRFKQCEWQRKILQHYQFYTLSSAVVAWPSGWRPYFFRWRKLRCRFKSQRGYFQFFYYYFLSSFFYPSAFYCLFSLLTLLASRDFCENVFLVNRSTSVWRMEISVDLSDNAL